MESFRKNQGVFWILAGPGSLWLLFFFLVPLGIVWVLSFGEKAVIDGKVSITETEITWTLANYVRALADPVYLVIMWKSIWVSALATALCLIIAYPVAFVIAFASPRWRPWLLLAVILPFWINLLIRTYALIAVFR
ncbi:MAG: ABC transporter permease, partial [Boseongicola sp. SB0677_bin_26]|nr:ABC transporter permease [Boseongicola sp. SB0677_bin_26]